MYYFRYFIKCCIRNISRLICKPKVLLVLGLSFLLLFCFGKMEVQAAMSPPSSNFEEIPGEYLPGLTLDGTISQSSASGNITTFNGFYLFFAPISYKGQKVGFSYQSNIETEYRYGFCEFPGLNGSPAYYQGRNTTGIGNLASQNDMVSPISSGYMVVAIYQGNQVSDIVFYSRETTNDSINNLGTTITENQNQNTEDIMNNDDENTDKIIESQEQIEDALTSTDYDESVVNIDTSDVTDVDDSSSNQLFTTIFTNFSNLLDNSNWSQVEVIEIGLPYTDGKIELRSDILSKIVGNSFLKTLINIAWYSLFGLYCFKFTTNIYRAIKSGDILNGLNLSDEVITSTML